MPNTRQSLKIFCNDRSGLLVDISKVFTEKEININGIHSKTNRELLRSVFFNTRKKTDQHSLVEKIRQIEKRYRCRKNHRLGSQWFFIKFNRVRHLNRRFKWQIWNWSIMWLDRLRQTVIWSTNTKNERTYSYRSGWRGRYAYIENKSFWGKAGCNSSYACAFWPYYGGCGCCKEFGVKIYLHEKDRDTHTDTQMNASWMIGHPMTYTADIFVKMSRSLR